MPPESGDSAAASVTSHITSGDVAHSRWPLGSVARAGEDAPFPIAAAHRRSETDSTGTAMGTLFSAAQASLMLASRADRVGWARRRYFDEGIAPSGVVSDAVFQSWARCQRMLEAPSGRVEFQPVTASRTQLSLLKNRPLLLAWQAELPDLERILGPSSCAAMLTDATGMLIGATCAGRAHERIMPTATRVGVDLSEMAVGTTAPGVAARTGQAVCVMGAEHYFEDVAPMHCAAAPIHDIQGRVAGALDISTEGSPFTFDAASVVGLFACAIENRLLVAQSREHLVVHFQVSAPLLDSPFVGLVGVDAIGRVAWCNGIARRLLGLHETHPLVPPSAEDMLGTRISVIASLPHTGAAVMTLPNGLLVWARASMRAPDGRRDLVAPSHTPEHRQAAIEIDVPPASEAATAPSPTTVIDDGPMPVKSLRALDRDVIARTLQECAGNVSRTARRLGVSRGLVYRRLRSAS
jgi:transcriptional regulator of acetoin/glycerol metabolism